MKVIRYIRLFSAGSLVFLLSACTMFDPAPPSDRGENLPDSFVEARGGNGTAPDMWWKELNSPELNRLIDEALSSNLNLKQAWARLKQARASAVIAGADQWPDLELSGDVSHAHRHENTPGGDTEIIEKNRALGLVSQYELDLWGRIRAGRKSGELGAKATREDLKSAGMTVSAEVARNWVRLVYEKKRQNLLQSQIETNKKYLQLTRMRFFNGMNTALDILQQKENLDGTRSRLPLTKSAQREYTHKLAFLLARPKSRLPECTRQDLPLPGPAPQAGLPAELLRQRPDIRAARNRLREAKWDLTAAKADLLPRITLTAKHEYSSDQFNTLFQNWVTSLAGGLTAPLFDGKRRAAEVDRNIARVEEHLHSYRETVLTAINEVEDALSNERWQRQYIKSLEKKLESARTALEQARSQYVNGMSGYLPVLTELISVQELELDLLAARKDLLLSRIALYRALGGTWTENLEEKGLWRPAEDGK